MTNSCAESGGEMQIAGLTSPELHLLVLYNVHYIDMNCFAGEGQSKRPTGQEERGTHETAR